MDAPRRSENMFMVEAASGPLTGLVSGEASVLLRYQYSPISDAANSSFLAGVAILISLIWRLLRNK